MRLIDADDFIAKFDHIPMVQEAIRKAMDTMPTIEERKTGRWIYARYPFSKCSNCECYFDTANNVGSYCPNCGADMRGTEND